MVRFIVTNIFFDIKMRIGKKLLNIYINGRFLTQPITGVQRSALEILKALDEHLSRHTEILSEHSFICLVPSKSPTNFYPKWKNIRIQQSGKLHGNLWEQIELPFFAGGGLLLCLCNIGPILHFNQVVVFHDASVFAVSKAYSASFKLKYRFIMRILARTAHSVITDSQFSRSQLAKYLKIKLEKISVVSLGSEHILESAPDYSVIHRNGLSENQYLITVGSSSPHKNVANLVNSFKKLNNEIDFVIVGGKFSKVFNQVEELEEEHILRLGYVSDNELRALYEKAVCLVFPSYYEGFGFPPLEAMRCGCPVLSSNRASLPEICGEAVIYFDPFNIEEIYRSILRIIENPVLQQELRTKGYDQALKFNWQNAAEHLMDIVIR